MILGAYVCCSDYSHNQSLATGQFVIRDGVLLGGGGGGHQAIIKQSKVLVNRLGYSGSLIFYIPNGAKNVGNDGFVFCLFEVRKLVFQICSFLQAT